MSTSYRFLAADGDFGKRFIGISSTRESCRKRCRCIEAGNQEQLAKVEAPFKGKTLAASIRLRAAGCKHLIIHVLGMSSRN